jgi:selenocysteine-specific elongation factor
VVEDPLPPHRRARGSGLPHSPAEHLARLLTEAGAFGVVVDLLPVRIGITPSGVERLLTASGPSVARIGARVYAASARADLEAALRAEVDAHHVQHPLEPGAPLQAMRGRLTGASELLDAVVAGSLAKGELAVESGLVRRADWRPRLSPDEEATREKLAAAIRAGGREPPTAGELQEIFGPRTVPLLRLLERSGSIVAVEPDRHYDRGVLERLIEELRGRMAAGREYGPGEMRDILGISRKYLIPLMEYCDRTGVTERRIGGRAIVGT